jgi:hypothetical protein
VVVGDLRVLRASPELQELSAILKFLQVSVIVVLYNLAMISLIASMQILLRVSLECPAVSVHANNVGAAMVSSLKEFRVSLPMGLLGGQEPILLYNALLVKGPLKTP